MVLEEVHSVEEVLADAGKSGLSIEQRDRFSADSLDKIPAELKASTVHSELGEFSRYKTMERAVS